ncbi:hypothetical protein DPMN_048590 [Dreissena polymorpha]|uniref:Uncharacterized protein n=1 Tax=Dreissena polymorpha TaxID=45954 RepID=A0A9D4DBG5_DREPO|nr:hypothetical protein DPMN_048590 [Dreissena polymorpha]
MIIWGDLMNDLRNLLTPPQQYLLQPETSMYDHAFVRNDSGEILVSAERWKRDIEYRYEHIGKATKNGPFVTCLANWDIVKVFPVRKHLP